MTERYGIWMTDTQRWFGFGVGFEYHPICWSREEAEAHCAKVHASCEARKIDAANVLDGLPYPEGAKKFATVRKAEDGTLIVAFNEGSIRANFEVGHLLFREGHSPELVPE